MNRTVEKNLIAIIDGLAAPGGCGGACSSSCACTDGSPAETEEAGNAC
jgi:hypothetical protein